MITKLVALMLLVFIAKCDVIKLTVNGFEDQDCGISSSENNLSPEQLSELNQKISGISIPGLGKFQFTAEGALIADNVFLYTSFTGDGETKFTCDSDNKTLKFDDLKIESGKCTENILNITLEKYLKEFMEFFLKEMKKRVRVPPEVTADVLVARAKANPNFNTQSNYATYEWEGDCTGSPPTDPTPKTLPKFDLDDILSKAGINLADALPTDTTPEKLPGATIVIGDDGKPVIKIPAVGTDGKPVLGDDGKPVLIRPKVRDDGTVVMGSDGKPVLLGADGKPVGADGKPIGKFIDAGKTVRVTNVEFLDEKCQKPKPVQEGGEVDTDKEYTLGKETDPVHCESGNILAYNRDTWKNGECKKSKFGIGFETVSWTGACGDATPGPGTPGPNGSGAGKSKTDDGKTIKLTLMYYQDGNCDKEMTAEMLKTMNAPKDKEFTLGKEQEGRLATCDEGTLTFDGMEWKNDECKKAGGASMKATWTGACGGSGMSQVLMWALIGGGSALVLGGIGLAWYCKSKQ